METKYKIIETKIQGLSVEEGRTKLTAIHNNKDLTFLHPAYGPDTYANVGAKIEQNGLAKPTMAETASLVHAAFNSDDKYSNEIRDIMKQRILWGFTGNLYIPKKGVYIEDNPEIRDVFMDESELIKKLEANDTTVRFVPFGYKIGRMSSLELAKNPYLIGLAEEAGADKLAQVADKHKNKPYLFSFNSVDKPITRVSALDSDWSLGSGLDVVGGYYCGDYWDGCAFGVLR